MLLASINKHESTPVVEEREVESQSGQSEVENRGLTVRLCHCCLLRRCIVAD